MTVYSLELKRGKMSLLIWTAAIALMTAMCVLIYPQMESQIDGVSDMFSSMGSFSEAFGMDRINFGDFIGFFSVECGSILGIGGAFFAAMISISMLSKEEKEHTAEFLFTHPLTRSRIITEKLLAVVTQIVVLNVVVVILTVLSLIIINEDVDVKILSLVMLSYLLMQLETAFITFGISAFLKGASVGLGLGLAAVFYFMNIISNLIKDTEFLKYITPFGYTEGADIITNERLSVGYLLTGIAFSVIGVALAYWKYTKKDIS